MQDLWLQRFRADGAEKFSGKAAEYLDRIDRIFRIQLALPV